MIRTRLYRGGELVLSDYPLADVSDYIEDDEATIWVDFLDPTLADLAALEEELSLHPLAVEDAVHEHQRPKLDKYDSHLFLSAYGVSLDEATGELSTREVKAFITPRALVTVHGEEFDIGAVEAHWDKQPDLMSRGVSFLLWGLLDTVVDGHFEAVQQLDTAIDTLEDDLFDSGPRGLDIQRRSYELRKSLVLLRRAVLPMREVVNTLMRRDLEAIDPTMTPYFQDVYDHVLRATEWTESLRDLVTSILDTNVGLQGNRMNLVMKKVTSWAAIIAVPTAITGFYGQNVPYPGFSTVWGFWTSSALIVGISVALYAAFRRNDWL
ncbi:magnesium transporter CorA family protein [Leifsonia sp. AG29]|uniref:magnesium transporter CorA family protein n=1 Tax=Leifsonia sp. AG29 TaxID=2598860 RepID=UPI00131E2C24|nr:magnesium transporter CorA family protein [Leifsonia sp. AG29]